jgi:SanA protein
MCRRLVIAGVFLLALAAIVAVCGWLVVHAGEGRLYTEVKATPQRDVGLLLGTSDKRKNGDSNPFFTHRIAAAALYKAGKVRHLLVSGDNRRKDYDEPAMMRAALLKSGVPESAITLDCAGFRTLDSVVRARDVFGLSGFTVISQRFHNQRALFIAHYYHLDAIGYCAADVGMRRGLKTQIREAFARVKAVLDLYVFHTQPKFRGPKIPLA